MGCSSKSGVLPFMDSNYTSSELEFLRLSVLAFIGYYLIDKRTSIVLLQA